MWLRFSVFSFLSGGKHFSHASSAASWWLTLTSHVVPTRGWNVLVHREGRGFIWSRANIQEQNTLFFRDPSNVAIKHLSQRYLTEAGFTGSTQIPILGVKSIQILIYQPIFTFLLFFFAKITQMGYQRPLRIYVPEAACFTVLQYKYEFSYRRISGNIYVDRICLWYANISQ